MPAAQPPLPDRHDSALPRMVLLLGIVLLAACGTGPSGSAAPAPLPGDDEWFTEEAGAAGLDFVHFNGMSGEFHYPEIMGPGVALLDYDNDGDLDVFVVQGQMLGGTSPGEALFPPEGPLSNRLYRNDLIVPADGTRTLRFTDVTARSGIDGSGYSIGVATGDVTNNGCIDLYVTALGPNQLFRNNCDGTFTNVSAESGTDGADWGVSATFLDYDRDGWLDLFVGNYVQYDVALDVDCFSPSGRRDYCPPSTYLPQPDRLLRNRGDGTFEDVTARSLLGGAYGAALGVSAADFNGNGWIDIYVANDGTPNQLWVNQGDGTFTEAGFLAGVAVNAAGRPEAGMGVTAGDITGNGAEDLFVTHWVDETNTLYVNDGGRFQDQTPRSGLGPPSLGRTGWGTGWLDVDNDGRLDLFVANGAAAAVEALVAAGDPFPFRQQNQLFRNLGAGVFEEVTDRIGGVFSSKGVSRGAAFGDIDNDGDIDIVVGNAAGPVRLYINQVGNRRHWIGLRLVGGDPLRDMLGARVGVTLMDGSTRWRRVRADGSYASANDPRVLVGLGDSADPPGVRVRWPDGEVESWQDVPVDRWTTLEQGTGR